MKTTGSLISITKGGGKKGPQRVRVGQGPPPGARNEQEEEGARGPAGALKIWGGRSPVSPSLKSRPGHSARWRCVFWKVDSSKNKIEGRVWWWLLGCYCSCRPRRARGRREKTAEKRGKDSLGSWVCDDDETRRRPEGPACWCFGVQRGGSFGGGGGAGIGAPAEERDNPFTSSLSCLALAVCAAVQYLTAPACAPSRRSAPRFPHRHNSCRAPTRCRCRCRSQSRRPTTACTRTPLCPSRRTPRTRGCRRG
jgi:hypothetical protein